MFLCVYLVCVALLKSLISYRGFGGFAFLVDLGGFSTHTIMSSENRDSLISPSLTSMPFISFLILLHWLELTTLRLIRIVSVDTLACSDLKRKSFQTFTVKSDTTYRWSSSIRRRYLCSCFAEIFKFLIVNVCSIISNAFTELIDMITWFSSLACWYDELHGLIWHWYCTCLLYPE